MTNRITICARRAAVWRTLLPLILAGSPAQASAQAEPPKAATLPTLSAIRKLSDDDLLANFQMVARDDRSTDAQVSTGNPADRDPKLAMIKQEIVYRGRTVAPALLESLRIELKRMPGAGNGTLKTKVQLLNEIADPRSVKGLLDLLADPSMMSPEILATIEHITHTSFRTVVARAGRLTDSVPHVDALPTPHDPHEFPETDYPKVVALYDKWLAGEGKDSASWIALAQKRAHVLLAQDDDLLAVYSAAHFLSTRARTTNFSADPPYQGPLAAPFDDDPARTVKRLGEVVGGIMRDTTTPRVAFRDHQGRLVEPIDWIQFLAAYGPHARPAAGFMIALHEKAGESQRDYRWLDALSCVGGPEVVSYFFKLLPAAPKDFEQSELRWQIDRFAGRAFDSDDERLRWWNANKSKSPEQWLRDSQLEAARRADGSGMRARLPDLSGYSYEEEHSPPRNDISLFRALYPDAPYGTDELVQLFPSRVAMRGTAALPFREKWIKDRQADLQYDTVSGTFRLAKRS